MTNALQRLTQSIDNLEEIIAQKLSCLNSAVPQEEVTAFKDENQLLKKELVALKADHDKLKETSKEVINELNSSIKVIEDYFKKQNANN